MPYIQYTLRGALEVPEGTTVNEYGHIQLPTGELLKLFEAVELNEVMELDETARNALGVFTTSTFDREVELCE